MTPAPEARLQRLCARLEAQGLDGMVLAAPENLDPVHVRYLTGFTGSSSYLLVPARGTCRALLITDSRYLEVASTLARAGGFDVRLQERDAGATLASAIRELGLRTLGFEPERVPVALFRAWKDALPAITWTAANDVLELRCRKDAMEIAALREAARRSGEALTAILPTLRGRTERDVARDLERRMEDLGLDGPASATI